MATPLFGMRNSVARRLALKAFRIFNPGDISIKHHWTGDKFRLHSFKHKGYWWHGKRREHDTILRFHNLITTGSTVVEVGGHIGYFAVLYSKLIGASGGLFVFEPGENNLPYLRKNLSAKENAKIIEEAVSNVEGQVTFWLEDLSGQNNSIIEDYHLLDGNIALSGLGDAVTKRAVHVPCTTIDHFAAEMAAQGKTVDFIKIDVEGAELLVLQGASALLKAKQTALMVEVTREYQAILDLMKAADYHLYFADGSPVTSIENMEGNIFCLPNADYIRRFEGK
jgi:FkbM family methyltransferase